MAKRIFINVSDGEPSLTPEEWAALVDLIKFTVETFLEIHELKVIEDE